MLHSQVHCQTFLSTFTILGANKRAEIRKQQLAAQREDWARQAEEQQKKVLSLSSKVQYSVDFDVSEVDKETAFDAKVKEVGALYDKLNFRYTGPWPPYNFVNIRLKLERARESE